MHWIDIGAKSAVDASRTFSSEVDGIPIVVVRCEDGYYAVEDRCTHDGESLAGAEVEDCEIICPRHFARFCLKTGDPLSPPAYEPVRTFAVREESGRILVQVTQPD